MTQHCFDPGAWVERHIQPITDTLGILGLELEEPRSTLGRNLHYQASRSRLAALPLQTLGRLLTLVAKMGLFDGNPAPDDRTPDHTLVVVSGLHRLADILPTLMGQNFICLPSSRDWNEHEDGPWSAIEAAVQRCASSKWCQWANSPQAMRRRNTLEPSFAGPHDSLYGLIALAIVDVSKGKYDLAYAVPNQLNVSRSGFPSRILLEGSLGSATIYPRMGVGRGSEWSDLKHWVHVAREQLLYMGPNCALRIVTHATSAMRMGIHAHEVLAQEWPNCRIDIVAPPVHPDDRHAWLSEALQELAILIGRSK